MENSNNNNQKWFDVLISNAQGKIDTVHANESEINLALNDKFFGRTKNFRDPITPNTVTSVKGVKQILPGDSEKVSYNIDRLHNLVDTLSEDCEISKFTTVSEITDTELHRVNGLFDLIIDLANSSKNEIEKQLMYLEFNEREY